MNEKQVNVLLQLRKNSRSTITEMSKKTQIPISTIFDMLRNNVGSLVKKYACVLDFDKIGFNCRAQVVLRVKKEEREEIKSYLLKHPNVNSVYKINNGYDYLIETVFRDLKSLEEFGEDLENKYKIKERKVYYIIEDIARERFMTDAIHTNLINA